MNDENSNQKKLLSVVISNKVRKGSIKVSAVDLPNLGVEIVDDVIITKVEGNESVTEMLFSDSKVQPGNVLVSARDAEVIGVEDGDKVVIEKFTNVQTPKEKENIVEPEKNPVQELAKKQLVKPSTNLDSSTNTLNKKEIKMNNVI